MSQVAISGNASGTGTLTIASPNTNSNYTLTLPTQTATLMANGPAFSAYLSTAQSVTNTTYTKAQFNTEEFDTNSNYDNTTNYRFTPTVAGYYQINGCLFCATTGSIGGGVFATIYKNGARFKDGIFTTAVIGTSFYSVVSALIYFNGSSDYVELWGYVTASGTITFGANAGTTSYFQGVLVRGA